MLPWRLQSLFGVRPNGQITLREYFKKEGRGTFKQILPAGEISLKLPSRTNLEMHHKHFSEINVKPYEECLLATVKGVKYIQLYWIPAVVSSNNKVLIDANKDPKKGRVNHPLLSIAEYPERRSVKGKSLMLSTDGGHNGYFHWMCRILTKLWVLSSEGIDINSFDNIIVNGPEMGFKNKSMNELGLPLDKILFANENVTYDVEELTIITNVRYHKAPLDFITESFLNAGITSEIKIPKVYFSRRKARIRKVRGEELLIAALEKIGFQVIELENYSISEQAQIFKNADIIVGPHGATFANLMFCSEGQKIVEILCNEYVNVNYWFYSNIKKLNYNYFMAPSEGQDEAKNINRIDISFGAKEVEDLVLLIEDVLSSE